MQQEGVNMQDIRSDFGIKSMRWKIEKRCLERIGHIMRMEDDRLVKAVTLGWLEDLEGKEKLPGRKRKTVLFYKRLVKEAGMDFTKIGELTKNRKVWKKKVKARMKHLSEWEKQRGKKSQGAETERNNLVQEGANNLICDVEGCYKVCKSKAGLVIHRKRMHDVSSQKIIFKCNRCNLSFKQEANLLNHKKAGCGGATNDDNVRKCEKCNKNISKGNIARHRRSCMPEQQQEPQPARNTTARVYVSQNAPCRNCGKTLSKTNMARHLKKCDQQQEAEL